MRRFLAVMALPALLAGCAVYPDGSLGPLPPAAPAGVYVPPPPVAYAPPVYGYGDAPPVYYMPPAPPPVVVSPSIGLGFYWGPRGYYGGRGYWGRPYRRW
jgi:hypothetical protein